MQSTYHLPSDYATPQKQNKKGLHLPHLSKQSSLDLSKGSKKFQRWNFQNALQKSGSYNLSLIKCPKDSSFIGFQSFQTLISQEKEKQKPMPTKVLNTAQDLIQSCLYFNKEQKNITVLQQDDEQQKIKHILDQKFKKQSYLNAFLQKNTMITQIRDNNSQQQMYPSNNNNNNNNNNQTQSTQKQEKVVKLEAINAYSFQINIPIGPPTLQSASLTNIQNKLYAFGGRSAHLNHDVYELNVEKWTWTRFQDDQKLGRYGHQAINFLGNLVVFGGEFGFNVNSRKRDCSQEIMQYDMKAHRWTVLQTLGSPRARRNFGCAVMGDKYIVVYGGIHGDNQFLNDISFLNMDTMEWEKKAIENDIDGSNGIALNTLVYLQKGNYKLTSLVTPMPELRKEQIINRIKEEGLYSFGGKKPNGQSSSCLKLLKLGHSTLKWQAIQAKGKGPTKRYHHTMNFQEISQSLVIHGGYSETSQKALNDLFILNLQFLQWIEINYIGLPVQPRFGHVTQVVNSCLIIFGGYDLDQHKNANIQVIELDQIRIKMRQTQQLSDKSPIISQSKKQKQDNFIKMKEESDNENQASAVNQTETVKQEVNQNEVQEEQHNHRPKISFLPVPKNNFLRTQTEKQFQK